MAVAVLPLLFLFLMGMGGLGQSPAEGAEEISGKGILPTEDLKVQIDSNSMVLSRLSNLMQNLIGVMSENPCVDTTVVNQVADVMADGFTSVLQSMREVKRAAKKLKLVSWRIDFVKTLNIPRMDGETPCPLPFFMLDGECIYLDTKVKRSFKNAKLVCNLMGGFLAEPESLEDFANYIHKMKIGGSSEVYIGLVSPAMDGIWQWQSSGEIVNQIPWEAGRPDKDKPAGCLGVKERKYKDIPCTNRKIFACEIAM